MYRSSWTTRSMQPSMLQNSYDQRPLFQTLLTGLSASSWLKKSSIKTAEPRGFAFDLEVHTKVWFPSSQPGMRPDEPQLFQTLEQLDGRSFRPLELGNVPQKKQTQKVDTKRNLIALRSHDVLVGHWTCLRLPRWEGRWVTTVVFLCQNSTLKKHASNYYCP